MFIYYTMFKRHPPIYWIKCIQIGIEMVISCQHLNPISNTPCSLLNSVLNNMWSNLFQKSFWQRTFTFQPWIPLSDPYNGVLRPSANNLSGVCRDRHQVQQNFSFSSKFDFSSHGSSEFSWKLNLLSLRKTLEDHQSLHRWPGPDIVVSDERENRRGWKQQWLDYPNKIGLCFN